MKFIVAAVFLSTVLQSKAQNFYDESVIQTIEIHFSQSNWDQLLDAEKAGNEDYIMADSVTINSTVFDSVGVKYKGNSTYSANQTKNPFHIELDTYKQQNYQGYKDIKLSNVKNDPSFVREPLSYKILRQYMFAPKSNYANVYVNGTLLGLYVNSEAINKTFLKDRFDDKNNSFFKCNPPAGAGPGATDLPSLEYLGTDTLFYVDGYEMKSDSSWYDLIALCDTLNNFSNAVADVLDVDKALYMMAFDNILVNLDSYIGGFKQNYYLYRDDYNKFLPIVWDLNESFGKFGMTGTVNLNSTTDKQQLTHLLHANDADYPLVEQLLANPLYKRMYLAHCKTILLENFDNGSYYANGQAMQATIDAAVQADGNKFYTYANFTDNLTSDVNTGGGPGGGLIPGITNLMDGRNSYLLAQSDFTATQPVISNIVESNSSPNVNDVITITAEIVDETDVYLGYRTEAPEHFTRVLMYDDGLHNDGASGDGTYGADVTITGLTLEYYIYADGATIGRFSPARAEHEYYQIHAAIPPVGAIVINELQADNTATVMDPVGEYDDWIELYNNSSNTILLDTMFLSDDVTNLLTWQFPAGATIAPGGYYIVWADDDLLQTGVHTSFKLSNNGESLFLTGISGAIIDQVTFGNQNTDETYGRYPNGTGLFQAMAPTHNAANNNELGVQDNFNEELDVLIYPNPAQDQFTIQISDPTFNSSNLEVYNMAGQLIHQAQCNATQIIKVESWSKGLYLIRIGNTCKKVLVK